MGLYRAFLYKGFLSEEECDHLITLVREDFIFSISFCLCFFFLKFYYWSLMIGLVGGKYRRGKKAELFSLFAALENKKACSWLKLIQLEGLREMGLSVSESETT